MHCLTNGGKLLNYHSLVNSKRTIADVILESDDLQEKVQTLADGKIASKEISRKTEYDLIDRQFYTLLLFNGYFNPMRDALILNNWVLSVPNKEIMDMVKQKIVKWSCKRNRVSLEELTVNARRLADCRLKEFEETLLEYMTSIPATSSKKYKFYNAFVKSIVYVLEKDYELMEMHAEKETAKAFLTLVAKEHSKWNNAIAIQYRSVTDWPHMQAEADNLMSQLNSRLNMARIRQYRHIKQTLKITMVFWNQRVAIQHRLEKIF